MSRTPGHVGPAGVPGWLQAGRGRGPASDAGGGPAPLPGPRGAGAWRRGRPAPVPRAPPRRPAGEGSAPPGAARPAPSPQNLEISAEPAGGGEGRWPRALGEPGGVPARRERGFRTAWESREKVGESECAQAQPKKERKSKSLQIRQEARSAAKVERTDVVDRRYRSGTRTAWGRGSPPSRYRWTQGVS